MVTSTSARRSVMLAGLLLALATGDLLAQAAVSGGFITQDIHTSRKSGTARGFDINVAFTVAPRTSLLVAYQETGNGAGFLEEPDNLGSFRTGLFLRVADGAGIDLDLGAGLGAFVLDQGVEEDGPGLVAFVEARLAFHPVPVAGVYVGGLFQALRGLGQNTGGHALGLTLGVQLRSPGW